MLRIAIDIDELFGSVPGGGGQGRVILNLIKELAKIDQRNQYTLFSVRRLTSLPEALKSLPANFRFVQLPSIKPQLLFLAWHTLRWPPLELFIGPHDIVHAMSPGIVPACRQARLILTVYDLVWWRFPEGLKPWGRFFQRTGLSIGAREATWVTAISEATHRDILACLSKQIEPTKVRTIQIATDFSLAPVRDSELIAAVRQKYGIQGEYILSIGTLEPRKNYDGLLQAYAALSPALKAQYQLVVVGAYGWKMSAIQTLITSLGLEKHVVWTDYIPDEDKHILLSGAVALVYPSLYEGFGIPILEAMALDVPVVTSNVSSLPEVAGDAALLVDPVDSTALSAAIARLLQDSDLRRRLIEKGRRQRTRFSYQRMAREFLELYCEAGGEKVTQCN